MFNLKFSSKKATRLRRAVFPIHLSYINELVDTSYVSEQTAFASQFVSLETTSFGKLASFEVSAVNHTLFSDEDTSTVGHLRVNEQFTQYWPILPSIVTLAANLQTYVAESKLSLVPIKRKSSKSLGVDTICCVVSGRVI